MDNRENVYNGLSKAAWGYFLLNFDINLGAVSILPSFAGCFLLYAALNDLAAEQRDLRLLRPLCLLLALWNLAEWLLSWCGVNINGHILFLDLLTAAAGLYFHFQFLTDMAALAEKLQDTDSELDSQIRIRRTLYLVLTTAIALLMALPLPAGEIKTWLLLGLVLVHCIAAFLVMFSLFHLRRYAAQDGRA